MDLQPCTAREFDVEVIRHANQPGWSYRIVHGVRCEGYIDGRLVLLMRNGRKIEYYAAPMPAGPVPVLPEGFTYK